ncbi:MAG: helix-turn-helix transcriptional regulator [Bacteroidetes bacterium]|nr:helix-turn-helix transcriptional regulator [Bacteroidota bacterium]
MNNSRNKVLKRIGSKIKDLRIKQNITQSQLGFEAEIPREIIGKIERAQINTTIFTLCKIAKALDVSVSELTKNIEG